jgi:hypothetical protein
MGSGAGTAAGPGRSGDGWEIRARASSSTRVVRTSHRDVAVLKGRAAGRGCQRRSRSPDRSTTREVVPAALDSAVRIATGARARRFAGARARLRPLAPAGCGQVETLQRARLVGQVATNPDGPPVAGVQALDRIRAANDLVDLDVVEAVADCLRRGASVGSVAGHSRGVAESAAAGGADPTRDYQPRGLPTGPPPRGATPHPARRPAAPHPTRHPHHGRTAQPQPESRLAAGHHPQGPALTPARTAPPSKAGMPASSHTEDQNATMSRDTCQRCLETSQRAGEGTRTPNLLFTRQLRYRLRHASTTTVSPSGRASTRSGRYLHQVLTSSCASDVRAIRLAAPLTASDATVPTRRPYTTAVMEIEACRRSRG